MQARWFLSQFVANETSTLPVCASYGARWMCPTFPASADGWALVQMYCDLHQVEAAAEDPRVLVMPLTFDSTTAVPQQVIDAYASWGAVSGMSLPALLTRLAATEPLFSQSL